MITRALLGVAIVMGVACGGAGSGAATTMPGEDPLAKTTAAELYTKGELAEQQGDLIRAEQYYSAAIDAGEPAARVVPKLIDVCVRGQRYQAALAHVKAQLQRTPEDWQLRYLGATLHAALGEEGAAERELRRVIFEKPEEGLPVFAHAELLWRRADTEGAHQGYRRYLELSPNGRHASEARARLSMTAPPAKRAAAPGIVEANPGESTSAAPLPSLAEDSPSPKKVSPKEIAP